MLLPQFQIIVALVTILPLANASGGAQSPPPRDPNFWHKTPLRGTTFDLLTASWGCGREVTSPARRASPRIPAARRPSENELHHLRRIKTTLHRLYYEEVIHAVIVIYFCRPPAPTPSHRTRRSVALTSHQRGPEYLLREAFAAGTAVPWALISSL